MSPAAKRHRPCCLSKPWAGLSPFSTISPSPRGERRRARWRNHCSFYAALPLERRERLMARHRGRLLYCCTAPGRAGPRFTWTVRCPRRASRSGRAPGGHGPGRRLVLAVGRSSRRRPGAGEASTPGRGRRIRSHPHEPHESALWGDQTLLGIISYRTKVKMRTADDGLLPHHHRHRRPGHPDS